MEEIDFQEIIIQFFSKPITSGFDALDKIKFLFHRPDTFAILSTYTSENNIEKTIQALDILGSNSIERLNRLRLECANTIRFFWDYNLGRFLTPENAFLQAVLIFSVAQGTRVLSYWLRQAIWMLIGNKTIALTKNKFSVLYYLEKMEYSIENDFSGETIAKTFHLRFTDEIARALRFEFHRLTCFQNSISAYDSVYETNVKNLEVIKDWII